MYKIKKRQIHQANDYNMEIEAPLVAKKAQPGLFIIIRTDKDSERFPLFAGRIPEALYPI